MCSKSVWKPFVGEQLQISREEGNAHDSYAVSVKEDCRTVVGHIPRVISRRGLLPCWRWLLAGHLQRDRNVHYVPHTPQYENVWSKVEVHTCIRKLTCACA